MRPLLLAALFAWKPASGWSRPAISLWACCVTLPHSVSTSAVPTPRVMVRAKFWMPVAEARIEEIGLLMGGIHGEGGTHAA